jgi:hypothetical protein
MVGCVAPDAIVAFGLKFIIWGSSSLMAAAAAAAMWNVSNAEYFGREYHPAAYRIARVKSDNAGRIEATFTAPDDFGFMHSMAGSLGQAAGHHGRYSRCRPWANTHLATRPASTNVACPRRCARQLRWH